MNKERKQGYQPICKVKLNSVIPPNTGSNVKMKIDKFYNPPIMFAIAESELQRFREIETENTLLKVQIEGLEKENERLKQENEQVKQKLDWFLTETVAGKEYRPKEELEELQRENEQLKAQIEKMKNHNNCKWFHEWNLANVMEEPLDDLSPCQGCKNFSLWELAE